MKVETRLVEPLYLEDGTPSLFYKSFDGEERPRLYTSKALKAFCGAINPPQINDDGEDKEGGPNPPSPKANEKRAQPPRAATVLCSFPLAVPSPLTSHLPPPTFYLHPNSHALGTRRFKAIS